MEDKKIFVTKPALPPIGEFEEYLEDIWKSSKLTNMGKYHELFRAELCKMMGIEHCMLFTNGHMALELGIQGMELTGEVITTPFSFASTTHAIVRNNLTPVFCDIKEDDCTIDESKIEALITDKTTAIVPVHVYGNPCNVETIEEIARKYNLKVIYDAAHAFGESIDGRSLMSYGDASMISFHATKAFHSIEGGCMCMKDEKYKLRLYQLENFGIMGEEQVEYVGANAKMNEFQAAMGLCNLKYFTQNVEMRKERFEFYEILLKDVPGIRFVKSNRADCARNYSYCPIVVNPEIAKVDRDYIYDALREHDIYSRKYFYPLINEFECYKSAGYKGETPIAQKIAKDVLTLPLYPELGFTDIERICEIIRKSFI